MYVKINCNIAQYLYRLTSQLEEREREEEKAEIYDNPLK